MEDVESCTTGAGVSDSEILPDAPTAGVTMMQVLMGSIEGGWDGDNSMLGTGGSAKTFCWSGRVGDDTHGE